MKINFGWGKPDGLETPLFMLVDKKDFFDKGKREMYCSCVGTELQCLEHLELRIPKIDQPNYIILRVDDPNKHR